MERDDDFEVIPENTPLSDHFKTLGYNTTDFFSVSVANEVVKGSESFKTDGVKTSVRNFALKLFSFLKKVFQPSMDFSSEADLIKKSGLLFKENVIMVEEFFPVHYHDRNYSYLTFALCVNLSIFSPLCLIIFKVKFVSVPAILLSFTTVYSASYIHQTFLKNKQSKDVKKCLSSIKQYNTLFLKSVQFVQENDKHQMKNCSNINKIEIIGFNSYKVLDPSWTHFKTNLVESAVALVKNLHSYCRLLDKQFKLNETHSYQSICSVDFNELNISDLEWNNHQAYIASINKIKLLLFLFESEFLSFVILSFSDDYRNSGSVFQNVLKVLNDSSNVFKTYSDRIESHFKKFYSFENEKKLYKKDDLNAPNPKIFNVFMEARALSLSTLSLATQVRDLENALENCVGISDSEAMFKNDCEVLAYADEVISNIECDFLSCQRRLKALVRQLTVANKGDGELSSEKDVDGTNVDEDQESGVVKTGIEVGASNFTPLEADEVYLGVSIDDFDKSRTAADDDLSEENLLAETFNRSSKKLIKELKVRLKDKKTERVEREKVVLERKNMSDLADDDTLSCKSSSDDEIDENQDQDCKVKDGASDMSQHKKIRLYPYKSPYRYTDEDEQDSEVISAAREELLPDFQSSSINPLAASVANISRSWNHVLSRTEECFGSDDETESDDES